MSFTTNQTFDSPTIYAPVIGECKSQLLVDITSGSVTVQYKLGTGWVDSEVITESGVYIVDRRNDMQITVSGTVEYDVVPG